MLAISEPVTSGVLYAIKKERLVCNDNTPALFIGGKLASYEWPATLAEFDGEFDMTGRSSA